MYHKPKNHGTPGPNNNSAFGRIVAGGSIMLFGLTVMSMLCGGVLVPEVYPFLFGLGAFCLCGVGAGLIMSGG